MKHFVIGVFLFFSCFFGPILLHAQNTIAPKTADSSYIDTIAPKKVLIVPFPKNMYISDMNRELTQDGKTDIMNVVAYFSLNAAGVLKQQLAPKLYIPEVLTVKDPDPKQDDDLKLVSRSISYKYDVLPAPVVLDKNKQPGKKSADKKEETEQHGDENTDKYMRTVITSEKLLPYLKSKYGFDYIIFLNQLWIRNDYSSPEANISGPLQRIIKLDYTVFSYNKNVLCSNRAAVTLPISVNKADEIIKKYFAPLAAQIAACLPEGAYIHKKIKK